MVENALCTDKRKNLKSKSKRNNLKPLPPKETAVRDDKASLVTLRVKGFNRAQPQCRCRQKRFGQITTQVGRHKSSARNPSFALVSDRDRSQRDL